MQKKRNTKLRKVAIALGILLSVAACLMLASISVALHEADERR